MHIRTLSPIGKALALVTVLFGAGIFTGCGNFFSAVTTTTTTGGNGPDNGNYVYVGKNGSNEVAAYNISVNGLTPITGTPFVLPANADPLTMVVTPHDDFLYVATLQGIYGYSLGTGGVLTPLNNSATVGGVPASFSPAAMAVTPDENWLIVMNNLISPNFYFYAITPGTGLLSATPSQEGYSTASNGTPIANSIQFSPITSVVNGNTQYIFAASFGSGGEAVYVFNPNITVPIAAIPGTPCIPPSASDSDNGVTFNSAGTSFIVVRGGAANTLISYTINPTSGVFNCTETVGTATTGSNPTAVSFSNSSNQPYIYVTNTANNSIIGYPVTTNASTPVTTFGTPIAAVNSLGTSPFAIAFDNQDLYMIALNQLGPADLVQYTVEPGTSLTPGALSITGTVTTGLAVQNATITAGVSGVSMALTH